jgi:hypothetical protein
MRHDMGDFSGLSRRRKRHDRTRPDQDKEKPGLSGRVFVAGLIVTILVLWGSLFLTFRLWKSSYRERAEFGAQVIAPAIDPLAAVVPPDVGPEAWHQAVADTHAMLVTVSGSNLLDRPEMTALGEKIRAQVASAHPETARDSLAQLWDEMERQAGPVVTEHHARPKLLPPSTSKKAGKNR